MTQAPLGHCMVAAAATLTACCMAWARAFFQRTVALLLLALIPLALLLLVPLLLVLRLLVRLLLVPRLLVRFLGQVLQQSGEQVVAVA